jgi:hypothetical protein
MIEQDMKKVTQAILECVNEKIKSGEVETPMQSKLDSFLGIRFGEAGGKYADVDTGEENKGDGTIVIKDDGKARRFLEFRKVAIAVSPSDKKVVCIVAVAEEVDADRREVYRADVLRLLQKKYGIEPIRVTFDDVRQKLEELKIDLSDIPEDIDEEVELHVLPFVDAGEGRVVASISLLRTDGDFMLRARDEEAYREMYRQEEQSQLDAL